MTSEPVLNFVDAAVWTPKGAQLLRGINWKVLPGQHWALLGPNGAGKSTLLSLAGAVRRPSGGEVSVLGGTPGRVNMPELRARIGAIDPTLRTPEWLPVRDVVLTGASGTAWPQWERYDDATRARATYLLDLLGCTGLAERELRTCSQGERQRVRIARALMPDPPLLLLDEPATGLDLPSREALLAALATLADNHPELATVLVSHHLEELPPTTSHALLLRHGAVVASGPVATVVTDQHVSACFGFPVEVHWIEGRWSARAAAGWKTRGAR